MTMFFMNQGIKDCTKQKGRLFHTTQFHPYCVQKLLNSPCRHCFMITLERKSIFVKIQRILLALCTTTTLLTLVYSCVYHDIDTLAPIVYTDSILYAESVTLNGYRYFRSGNRLSPASESPHEQFRLRFNDIAWRSLDSNEELPAGNSFPEGSVIVKEMIIGDKMTQFAVMKKASSDGSAVSGWIWAAYLPNGEATFSLNRKGDACVSCHGDSPNRDFVRTFDLH